MRLDSILKETRTRMVKWLGLEESQTLWEAAGLPEDYDGNPNICLEEVMSLANLLIEKEGMATLCGRHLKGVALQFKIRTQLSGEDAKRN